MGLTKFIKNKAKEAVTNYKAERAHSKEERLEQRNQYEKGRREGEYRKGIIQGEGRGHVTEYTEYNSKGKPIKTERYGNPNARVSGGGSSGGKPGFRSTIKKSDGIFGWSGTGGLNGPSIGLFGGAAPKRPITAPVRTRTIMPNGKVVISEPIQQQPHHESNEGNSGMGIGINDFMGPSGLNKKGKKEKHPYDLF